RSVVTRRLKPVPVEAIARGYLIGSGWKDYQRTGRVSGILLPDGLRQAEKLPQPIFTPSTKAAAGDHDENIDFDAMVRAIGGELAEQVRDATLRLYAFAAGYAAERGIILADTKFEFGTDADGRLYVMDEMLTPDSSRYWPADAYEVGTSPPSYDKQFVRDWLETQDWDKTAPGPRLPAEVLERTRAQYAAAPPRPAGTGPATGQPVATLGHDPRAAVERALQAERHQPGMGRGERRGHVVGQQPGIASGRDQRGRGARPQQRGMRGGRAQYQRLQQELQVHQAALA